MNMKTPLVPFQAGSPIMVAGPTASGKTYWTNKLLSNNMFTQPVSSILYCYGVWQDYFEEMEIPNLEFHDGLPSEFFKIYFLLFSSNLRKQCNLSYLRLFFCWSLWVSLLVVFSESFSYSSNFPVYYKMSHFDKG